MFLGLRTLSGSTIMSLAKGRPKVIAEAFTVGPVGPEEDGKGFCLRCAETSGLQKWIVGCVG